MHTGFWWGKLPERDHLEDSGVDERIKLRWSFRKSDEAMDWIDLAQDSDRWRTLVNAVMNLGVHKMLGISCLAENRLASQEGLCCTE